MTANVGSDSALKSTVWVPLKELYVEPHCQRPLESWWADMLVEAFDENMLGVVHVSKRSNGRMVILDGQHRREAVKRVFNDEHRRIECKVYEGLSKADEAKMFKYLNTTRQQTRVSKFIKGVLAKEPIESAIDSIVRAAGCRVEAYKGARLIPAVAALEAVYAGFAKGGIAAGGRLRFNDPKPELLRDVLAIITSAWGGIQESYNAYIIEGVGRLLMARQRAMDTSEFISKLAATPGGPQALVGIASGRKQIVGGAVSICMAESMLDIYNKGRRVSRLEPLR